MTRTVWVSAGGTGGHIYPAITLYNELQDKGLNVTFIGGDNKSMEQSLCKDKNIHFHATNNIKWQGWLKVFFWLAQVLKSLWDLSKLRRKEKPACILIMGGYPCITSGLVAILTFTPLFIHEQNSVMGLTNRLMYPFAKKGFCAYSNLHKKWPKLMCVGNPSLIKPIAKPRMRKKGKFNILSFGGSGGARQLNELMCEVIKSNELKECAFWHITGEQSENLLTLNGKNVKIEAYNHDIIEAYSWADLAITRSGAMTITELILVGLPSLLLPYPYATNDHQTKNAEYVVKKGCALICENKASKVIQQIQNFISNESQYNQMAQCVFNAKPKIHASEKISKEIMTYIKVV